MIYWIFQGTLEVQGFSNLQSDIKQGMWEIAFAIEICWILLVGKLLHLADWIFFLGKKNHDL